MLEKLTQALKLAGLNEGLASLIDITQIKDESQIANVVAQLKGDSTGPTLTAQEMLTSETFNKFLKENGFEAVLKMNKGLRSEHDKKVHQGIKTFKQKIVGEGGEGSEGAEGSEGSDGSGAETPKDMPDWFKPFAQQITGIVTAQTVGSKTEKAQEALNAVNLPPALKKSWINRIDLESDVSFADQAKALAEEYKSIHVGIVGNESYEYQQDDTGPSGKKKGLSEAESKELADMAKDL